MKRTTKRKPVPGWLVLAVVLVTGATTVWAMLQTARGRGWTAEPNQVFPPRDATHVLAPSLGALENSGVQVAAVGTAPVIVAGARAKHGDIGTCVACHTVFTNQGALVPAISALATVPHEARGVCTNCHHISTTSLPAQLGPAAATVPPHGPVAPQPLDRSRGAAPTQF